MNAEQADQAKQKPTRPYLHLIQQMAMRLAVIVCCYFCFGFCANAQPGSLGAWNATASLPYPVDSPAAVALNGYIYVFGGYANPQNVTPYLDNSVHSAAVNSDGTLQPWQTTTPFSTGRRFHAVALDSANSRVYIIGGCISTSTLNGANDVQYAYLSAGGVSSWTSTTPLPSGISGHSALCYDGYLYVFRGNDQFGGAAQGYYYAPISPFDGSLGTWRQGTLSFPVRRYFGTFVYNDHFYLVGGAGGFQGITALNDVYSTRVPQRSSLPYLQLNETEFWNTTTPFQTARWFQGTANANGFAYITGGQTTAGSPPDRSDVQYAQIMPDGSVGLWFTTASLPTTLGAHACVISGSHIYVLGGDKAVGFGFQQVASVLYAPILSSSDTTPPITQASPPPGPQVSTSVSVTLTATDVGGTGVASLRYTLNGSDPTLPGAIVSSVPTVTVSITTPETIRVSAIDVAGNQEPINTFQYTVGTSSIWTPPQPTIDPLDESPNHDVANRGIGDIDSIVIHTTELGQSSGSDSDGYIPSKTFAQNQMLAYTAAINFFKDASSQVSAHYIVGPNGEIHEMVKDKDIAYHATYYNPRAIGIECAGFGGRSQTWNPQLTSSLVKLVAWLCAKYHISVVHPTGNAVVGPLRSYGGYGGLGFKPAGLVGHDQIQTAGMSITFQGNTLGIKTDPGIYFPWTDFTSKVLAALNPTPGAMTVQQISLTGLSDLAQTTPTISADGTWIGYRNSPVYHLVNNSSNSIQAENFDGEQTRGNGSLFSPAFSADGSIKAFASDNANLVDGDTNGVPDIFIWHQDSSVTERISVNNNGDQANGASYDVGMSADGSYVVFTSVANNLVANDTNQATDVFIRDRQTNQTFIVSVNSNGIEGNGPSYSPSISADGHYVAFVSEATNLVAGDANGVADIFVRDLQANTTTLVSKTWNGSSANGASRQPSISGDGRYIAYESDASNLVLNDTNGFSDVFLYDSALGTVQKLSVGPNGEQGNGNSHEPRISSYGLRIAFTSEASNLAANDTNGLPDVFEVSFAASPVLNASLAGNNIVLSWTTNNPLFNLESTTNLNLPVWLPVSPTPTIINDQNFVTNPISGSAKFYRLKN
jgi:N-acetyl-anhydromuramyl-L-alanine amidase AmpD/N-acetylneuraminic acid mutarotase